MSPQKNSELHSGYCKYGETLDRTNKRKKKTCGSGNDNTFNAEDDHHWKISSFARWWIKQPYKLFTRDNNVEWRLRQSKNSIVTSECIDPSRVFSLQIERASTCKLCPRLRWTRNFISRSFLLRSLLESQQVEDSLLIYYTGNILIALMV